MLRVSGYGAVSSLGGTDDGFAALCEGRHGFGPGPAWAPAPVAPVRVEVEGPRTFGLAAAGLPENLDPDGLAVVFATTTSAMREGEAAIEAVMAGREAERPGDYFWGHLAHVGAEWLATRLGATGPWMTVSTACTSGTVAIGVGADLVRAGRARRALVVGADALCRTTVFGFRSLGAYTADRCRPFDRARDGMALGEAGAWLLLEPGEGEIELVGVATATDGQHLTAPDPAGAGIARAVRAATGGLAVDHVNAHATGTETNDGAEAAGLAAACPGAAVSATKGATGHTLGAAGVLEAVFLIQSMRAGVIPPVVGLRDALDVDVSAAPRRRDQRVGVSVNLAFGGHNAAVCFRRRA
ncbi:MAG: beta-ketoacyl synthase N-terminal-like domain-containing protein [Myxococcota bacterium]